MLNINDIMETINMISEENLDIRTITMGISLLDCADSDIKRSCDKVYEKITRLAGNLVKTGEDIEREYGIPIINKRISVTPIAMSVLITVRNILCALWARLWRTRTEICSISLSCCSRNYLTHV